MVAKVAEGNSFCAWLSELLEICCALNIVFWIENPDASFYWLQPHFIRFAQKHNLKFYRCDFCFFGTRWRKRTKFCTNNCCLAGMTDFCKGGHEHIVLRGRSSHYKCSWTKLAEPYPRKLCSKLAWAAAYELALLPRRVHRRIGEAKNPGPKRNLRSRVPGDLEAVELVRPATLKLGIDQWSVFLQWVRDELGDDTLNSCLVVPGLLALALRAYGKVLYENGRPLYHFRHLIIHGQRTIPALRQLSKPAWELVTRWEALEPLKHRPPLPHALLLAMATVGLSWGWFKWVAVTLIAYYGACRPGEVLQASRKDLVLPSDLFLEDNICFLQIAKPKSGTRGLGAVQHTKIIDQTTISLCEAVFASFNGGDRLFAATPSTYRRRWDSLLKALDVPGSLAFTPGSLRGGGAVHRYRSGGSVTDIMWLLRVKHVDTLQHYLQEVTASLSLASLPPGSKQKVQASAAMFPFIIHHFLLHTETSADAAATERASAPRRF